MFARVRALRSDLIDRMNVEPSAPINALKR